MAESKEGGEAYIPLDPAKRSLSHAIMAEVAERFGGIYLPPQDGSDDG